jgi:hypothetical protein
MDEDGSHMWFQSSFPSSGSAPFLEAIEVYITRDLVEPAGILYGDGFLRTSVSNGIHIRMEKGQMRME